MLTLDGSTLEGGGQLVRVALSLSSICSIPVRITNIRANRASKSSRPSHKPHAHSVNATQSRSGPFPGGGLKESHLAAMDWLADQCGADVEGNEVGCREVVFRPGRRNVRPVEPAVSRPEVIQLQNPGSVWLIWQAIFPYIVHSIFAATPSISSLSSRPFRITLRGGTNVPKSPSSEYMQQVFVPLCERIGLPKVDILVLRRGWAGSAPEIGEVEISVYPPSPSSLRPAHPTLTRNTPSLLQPFHLHDRGSITHISMTIIAGSHATQSLLESQLRAALSVRPILSSVAATIHAASALSHDERRLYTLLVANTSNGYRLGRDQLGSGRKITSEADRARVVREVVSTVVRDFVRECERDGCVDEFAEDQLVIFQALNNGSTRVDADGGLLGREQRQRLDGYERDETESGSLHTRTVRWVCEKMLERWGGGGGQRETGESDD
ncbi:hypothetical protein LTR72_009219 [Exophiala xenobiotica]|nr:hypothetical protein LTR72_009219 [Exophiala xenobiotica]KAK5288736.1 hypothetical protein LTR14_008087 [Exophiala xenobiotica]KAK5403312.1 hypothetical protein LTR79_000064 [Exophiala xenobiotica]KAK5468841.1 hypothetical protein LTR20_003188 [Exophiala xenobiotica]KAK5477000.1 hypothetical protein LTR55_008558 [Exophiala xenobiotica]